MAARDVQSLRDLLLSVFAGELSTEQIDAWVAALGSDLGIVTVEELAALPDLTVAFIVSDASRGRGWVCLHVVGAVWGDAVVSLVAPWCYFLAGALVGSALCVCAHACH
jgi:hypothetical protein